MLVYYFTAGLLVGFGFLVFKTFLNLWAAVAASVFAFSLVASFPLVLISLGGSGTLFLYSLLIPLIGGAVFLLHTRVTADFPALTPSNYPAAAVASAAGCGMQTPVVRGADALPDETAGRAAAAAGVPDGAEPVAAGPQEPEPAPESTTEAPLVEQQPPVEETASIPGGALVAVDAPSLQAADADAGTAVAVQEETAAMDDSDRGHDDQQETVAVQEETAATDTPAEVGEVPDSDQDSEAATAVAAEEPAESSLSITELVSRALRLAKQQDHAAAVRLLQGVLKRDPSPYLAGLIVAELSSIYQHLGQYWMSRELLRVFLAGPGTEKHLLTPILREKLRFCDHLMRLLHTHNLGQPPYDHVPESIKREAFLQAQRSFIP
ncbi:MAG: hypothetical protein IBX71_07670 [Candidatus Desulforudis sp.]|nr:hypothetical protein [Desulforudis sp.]